MSLLFWLCIWFVAGLLVPLVIAPTPQLEKTGLPGFSCFPANPGRIPGEA